MSQPICAYCGRAINSGDKCRTNYRGICHASEATCVEELRAALTASTSALASAEDDLFRLRLVLAALRNATARYGADRSEYDKSCESLSVYERGSSEYRSQLAVANELRDRAEASRVAAEAALNAALAAAKEG